MVRRNAALALVRFGDARGHDELVAMLEPYTVRAAAAGQLAVHLELGREVGSRTMLGRIRSPTGGNTEIRSPVFGRVAAVYAWDGAQVAAGDRLVSVSPAEDEVWEALRALYLVGRPDDLGVVERYSRGAPDMPERVRDQATLTAQAIRMRAERNPIR
jgi:hypothetical protein